MAVPVTSQSENSSATAQTKTAHTPGPWTAEACFRYDRSTQTRVPDGFELHGPNHEGVGGVVENEADANLLAAAPEMLRLLLEGREWFPSEHGTGNGAKWRKQVEDLITLVRNPEVMKPRGGQ